jgi:hypothetical protein
MLSSSQTGSQGALPETISQNMQLLMLHPTGYNWVHIMVDLLVMQR